MRLGRSQSPYGDTADPNVPRGLHLMACFACNEGSRHRSSRAGALPGFFP